MKFFFLSIVFAFSINLSFGQADKFEHCAAWINDQLKYDRTLPDSSVNIIEFKNNGTVAYDSSKLANFVHADNYSEFFIQSSGDRTKTKKIRVEKNSNGQISKVQFELPVMLVGKKPLQKNQKTVYEYNFAYDKKGCRPENSRYLEAIDDGPLTPTELPNGANLDYQKCARLITHYKKLPEESNPKNHYITTNVKLPPPDHLQRPLVDALNNFHDPELTYTRFKPNLETKLTASSSANIWKEYLIQAISTCGNGSPNSLSWFVQQREVTIPSREIPSANSATSQ